MNDGKKRKAQKRKQGGPMDRFLSKINFQNTETPSSDRRNKGKSREDS